jgi:GAF domain-containing protein
VATAIANAEARAEIGRLAEEQAALRRVATLVAKGTQPDEVFAAVAEEIGRILDAEVTCVLRYEADVTGTVMATWGDASFWPDGSNWALEDLGAQVFRTRRTVRIDSRRQLAGEDSEMAEQIASRVAAPIIIDDRPWGAAVALNFASGCALPAAAEERIANFADLITTAMSNAQTRSELIASRTRIVAAADQTRRRLERDLHDGIQQRLVSLALKARATGAMTAHPRTRSGASCRCWPTASAPRWMSCGKSHAASTRPCCPRPGSARRSKRSPGAPPCRSNST